MNRQKLPVHAELIISRVLQVGVSLSAVIILVGIGLFFVQSDQNHALNSGSYHQFTATTFAFPHSITALSNAVQAGEGTGFIEFGVLLLILTPILRVAFSIVLFWRQHDRPMVGVTLAVLLVLVGSFILGVVVQ